MESISRFLKFYPLWTIFLDFLEYFYLPIVDQNKLAKQKRCVYFTKKTSQKIQFEKIQFGKIHLGKIQFGKTQFGKIQFGKIQLGKI